MAQTDEDERLTAAMAHASMVANAAGLTGLVLTVILWATQRRRSRFVRAHIVQALVYQAGTLLGVVLLMLLWSGCVLLSLLPAALRPDLYRDGTLPDTFWVALFGLILPIGYGIAATLYALYGAYQVYRGNRFTYPLAGRLVARDLEEARSGAAAAAEPLPDGQSNHAPTLLPKTTPAPSSPPPVVAAQPLASVERSTPPSAPPVAPQARAAGEESTSAPSAPSPGTASVAVPPALPETPLAASEAEPPAAASDESAPPLAGGTPPIPSASDVAEVVPVQDALDQGSRSIDRGVVLPANAASTNQPPEER